MDKVIKENNTLIAIFMGYSKILTIEPGYWANPKSANWHLYDTLSPITQLVRLCNPNDEHDWMEDDETEYHKDWNELMKVVEKIESLEIKHASDIMYPKYKVNILYNQCYIDDYAGYNGVVTNIANEFGYYQAEDKSYKISKIQAVYKAIVEFIKWYNEKHNIKPTYKILKPENSLDKVMEEIIIPPAKLR